MGRFLTWSIVLQIIMVSVGHFNAFVLNNLSAVLGMGIPLVIGFLYGRKEAASLGQAAGNGFVIGAVGAAIGIAAAVLMGDQMWSLLAFGTVSSGITGLIGGLAGSFVGGRDRAA